MARPPVVAGQEGKEEEATTFALFQTARAGLIFFACLRGGGFADL